MLCLEPEPVHVTPADTTALYPPQLASALIARHPGVTGTVYPHNPKPTDIAAIVEQAKDHDVIVLGTVTATHGQVDLAQTLLRLGKPMVTLRAENTLRPSRLSQIGDTCLHYGSTGPLSTP